MLVLERREMSENDERMYDRVRVQVKDRGKIGGKNVEVTGTGQAVRSKGEGRLLIKLQLRLKMRPCSECSGSNYVLPIEGSSGAAPAIDNSPLGSRLEATEILKSERSK